MNKKTQKTMFSSKSDEWATPQWIFDLLNEIQEFTLDPAATKENHKCPHYFTQEEDGLTKDWGGHHVFINPPYSRGNLKRWIQKAYEEGLKPNTSVVMLIPARTDTKYFHDYVLKAKEVCFVKGRITFVGAEHGAPFPSMMVVFDGEHTKPKFTSIDLKEYEPHRLKEKN